MRRNKLLFERASCSHCFGGLSGRKFRWKESTLSEQSNAMEPAPFSEMFGGNTDIFGEVGATPKRSQSALLAISASRRLPGTHRGSALPWEENVLKCAHERLSAFVLSSVHSMYLVHYGGVALKGSAIMYLLQRDGYLACAHSDVTIVSWTPQ